MGKKKPQNNPFSQLWEPFIPPPVLGTLLKFVF